MIIPQSIIPHNEKVKGLDEMGKIVWVPKKLLGE